MAAPPPAFSEYDVPLGISRANGPPRPAPRPPRKSPQMTTYFVRRLKDDNNVVINRAAIALSRLRDSDATLPLIEVLWRIL